MDDIRVVVYQRVPIDGTFKFEEIGEFNLCSVVDRGTGLLRFQVSMHEALAISDRYATSGNGLLVRLLDRNGAHVQTCRVQAPPGEY